MARFRSDALKLKAATTSAACPASRNASARSSSTSSSIISPWTHSSKESRRCASKWGAAAAEMASSSASLAAGSRRDERAASTTARRPRWASLPWARRKGGEHGREGGRVPFSFHRTAFLFLLRGLPHGSSKVWVQLNKATRTGDLSLYGSADTHHARQA
eukprot:scaffold18704_cov108-Isochrysis_galbana.AAC.2